jgi:hypothetical protein
VLPLVPGINEGGHYFRYFSSFFSFLFLCLPPLFKTREGFVVVFQIFAWAPKKYKKNVGDFFLIPPPPLVVDFYVFLNILKVKVT